METKIKTCIIDDEQPARETLKGMLTALCPEIEVVGEASDVVSGLKTLRQHRPQLVFLDIQMPDGTGFDLLNRLEFSNFSLIFLTAHDTYAVKAFKYSAIDYLLKPLDPDDLCESVHKAVKQISDKSATSLSGRSNSDRRIILKTTESIYVVQVSDVIRCEASGNYTTFHLTGSRKILVSKTLKDQEEILEPYGFLRVHQSHLINLSHILRIDKTDGSTVVTSDNVSVPVSYRKKEALLKKIEEM